MMFQEMLAGPFGPLMIFSLRVVDVSMATVRMLLIVRNHKVLVPILGFFEVLIWVFAVGTVVQNLSSPLHLVGYAGGFATGSLVGLTIEERMALGLSTVRAVVKSGGAELARMLRAEGFGVTEMVGSGRDGPVEVLHSVVPRREVVRFVGLIDEDAPDAFVVVDEPRRVRRGWLFSARKK